MRAPPVARAEGEGPGLCAEGTGLGRVEEEACDMVRSELAIEIGESASAFRGMFLVVRQPACQVANPSPNRHTKIKGLIMYTIFN